MIKILPFFAYINKDGTLRAVLVCLYGNYSLAIAFIPSRQEEHKFLSMKVASSAVPPQKRQTFEDFVSIILSSST